MADKKRAAEQQVDGGNAKSSGKGGGKSFKGGPAVDPVGNARLRGEDPSPDNRRRGEISHRE
jgi:hypothetical protein